MNANFQFRLWELVAWSVGIDIELRQAVDRPRFKTTHIPSDKINDFNNRIAAAADAIHSRQLTYMRAIIDCPQCANFIVNAGAFSRWAKSKALTLPPDAPVVGPGAPPADWKKHAEEVFGNWCKSHCGKRPQRDAADFIKTTLEVKGVNCPDQETIIRDFLRGQRWDKYRSQQNGGN